MTEEVQELRFIISYKRASGEELTQLESDIIELIDEMHEKCMPTSPGLSKETLAAIDFILKHST